MNGFVVDGVKRTQTSLDKRWSVGIQRSLLIVSFFIEKASASMGSGFSSPRVVDIRLLDFFDHPV